jgi:membrane-associated phospholipid phosphatase
MEATDATTISQYNPRLRGGLVFILFFIIWVITGGVFLIREENRSVYKAINEQHTPFLDAVLPYVTHMGTAPFVFLTLLVLLLFKKFRTKKLVLAFAACNLLPFIVTQIIKNLVNAPRPLKYFEMAEWINFVEGQPQNFNYSFPSGHSEGAFAFFCFLALILPRKYTVWGALFFLLALMVGYSRIYLSQHFYLDVYVGSIIGTVCCLLAFWLVNPFKLKTAVSKMHPQSEAIL